MCVIIVGISKYDASYMLDENAVIWWSQNANKAGNGLFDAKSIKTLPVFFGSCFLILFKEYSVSCLGCRRIHQQISSEDLSIHSATKFWIPFIEGCKVIKTLYLLSAWDFISLEL